MPRHERPRQPSASRARIASAAARLMAEDGVTDFGLAKRKAARQLGLSGGTPLPDNAEVEAALRAHHELYQEEEHPARLHHLRSAALEVMEWLHDFHPYLTGPVLEGVAGRYAGIDILLFAESVKEVEIYLLNRSILFEHVNFSNERAEAVLQLLVGEEEIRLTILDPVLERTAFRSRDGRLRQRARIEAVRSLLLGPGENPVLTASGDEAR